MNVTPPTDRVVWGGLTAAAGLALCVLMERWWRLRPARIVPKEFESRFLERLHDGRAGPRQALDYCELNPSPAARVALAAVKRWGRPVAISNAPPGLAHRVEADRLRRECRHAPPRRRVNPLARSARHARRAQPGLGIADPRRELGADGRRVALAVDGRRRDRHARAGGLRRPGRARRTARRRVSIASARKPSTASRWPCPWSLPLHPSRKLPSRRNPRRIPIPSAPRQRPIRSDGSAGSRPRPKPKPAPGLPSTTTTTTTDFD